MRIVFWQNILSHLQSSYIRALAEKNRCEVILVVEQGLSKRRIDMGWSIPDFGKTKIVISPDKLTMLNLIRERESESTHIFGNMHAYPMVSKAFLHCLNTKVKIGILSEPENWKGLKGVLRIFRGRSEAVRYQKKIDFILAIGHMAIEWFKMIGYPEEKIYPFAYFREKPQEPFEGQRQIPSCDTSGVQLIFIGQLIHRKGVDLLLKALKEIEDLQWHLKIIGDGKKRRELEFLCGKLNLSKKISFLGSLEHAKAMQVLSDSNLLVLPSRWDGWGAVVNEALMRAVPVVCSDRCGAADLIVDKKLGEVFCSDTIGELRDILRKRISEGKSTLLKSRQQIIKWSKQIEGEMGADYLINIISSPAGTASKPVPPWKLININ